MDKKEAIKFLQEQLVEVARLKKLPHDNQEYPLWSNVIKGVLETVFGLGSFEYKTFYDAGIWRGYVPDSEIMYIETLKKRKTAIKSIIQKNEKLGIEEKPAGNDKKSIYQKIWYEVKEFIASIIAKFLAEKSK